MLIAQPPKKRPVFRHYADAYLPQGEGDQEGYGARGEVIESDRTHVDIPVDVREVRGSEIEETHELWAGTSHIVRCFGDPSKPLTEKHILKINGLCYGIGYIKDEMQNHIDLELLCAKTGF